MNAENPNEHDWHDKLLDRTLAEVVGGETPPDLSNRILTAAEAEETLPVTLSEREHAMRSDSHYSGKLARNLLAGALAVGLLGVVVGILLPPIQASRERQRGSSDLALLEEEQALPQLHPTQSSTAKEQRKEDILGRVVDRESILSKNGTPPHEVHPASPSPYYMTDDVQYEAPAPTFEMKIQKPSQPQSTEVPNDWAREGREKSYGLQGLIADAYRPESGPISNQAEWEELTTRRKKYAEVDLSKRPKSEVRDLLGSQGQGPGKSGDKYTRIQENPFIVAQGEQAVSTFSIDVDTASYANVRQFLTQSHMLPPPDAVRIEELVNYFDYDYAGPTDERPFAAHLEVAACPWNDEHRLIRIGLKGREMDRKARPLSNLVFLVDVSGSMNEPNKLPLLVEGMKLLTRELGENDKISIVVYASSEGLALPSTRGDQQQTILSALDQLRAGGSTAGGAGIALAYKTAQENFVKGGVNRVILCTDGDFNVGVTSTAELERMAEQKAKDSGVFLTVLGFGRGNLNDAMMEAISNKGNGNYNYVDNFTEARKVLVEEMTGTLVTIAKDVKIQVEFNPAQVAGYRLLGYENRMLRTEDFNDDKKDAGEIGAGHTVTALYEIVPAGKSVDAGSVDPLKYQQQPEPASVAKESDELLTLKLRYKEPDGNTSTKIEFPLSEQGGSFSDASEDFRFAAAVASYGMLLRNSEYKGNATFNSVLDIALGSSNRDPHGYRAEFLELVRLAGQLQQ